LNWPTGAELIGRFARPAEIPQTVGLACPYFSGRRISGSVDGAHRRNKDLGNSSASTCMQTAFPSMIGPSALGVAAISVYEPQRSLDNAWFAESLPQKFVKHTGTRARRISDRSEVDLAYGAVRRLQREWGVDLRQCAAIVYVSPSHIPLAVARRLAHPDLVRREQLFCSARRLARRLGIPACPVYGMNWFCSGYSKAVEVVRRIVVPMLGLGREQFVLVTVASRISRITDYECASTGALFGDLASATLIARCDSPVYPVHFEIHDAFACRRPAPGAYFDFELRDNVLFPDASAGRTRVGSRIVFRLDGLNIADIAPRAMASALESCLRSRGLPSTDLQFVVPHQAGSAIVRLAAMKFEQLGVRASVINDVTSQIGNVSSCSIPFALRHSWHTLHGWIACPTAAVGAPGKAEVSQGCILLRSTPWHQRAARAS
jgi:3-oxoacyl-[acyl-carrier-protein] synthase-3